MTIELVAVIVTGVVSTFDLFINVATLCLTGRCRSDCCGAHFEHDDESKTPRMTESQMEDIKKTISK